MHVSQTPETNPILLWFWMLDVAVEEKEASPWLILGYSSVLSAFKTRSLLSKCSFLCPFLKFSSIIWPVQLIIKRTPRHFSEFISVSLHWMFSGKGEGLYLQQSSTNFSTFSSNNCSQAFVMTGNECFTVLWKNFGPLMQPYSRVFEHEPAF